MKAIRVHRFGAPSEICLEEVPRPEPGDLEILVEVAVAGVGPWDAWVRAGKSVVDQPLPLTPGSDLSGHVAALGRGVSGFQVGQAVYGVTNARFTGAYAEFALADANRLAAKPRTLDHLEAASVPVVATTAHQMLFEHGRVRAGQRVLVLGAGGNVGAFAVQLARHAGAEVIGADQNEAAAYAQTLGAKQVIDVHAARFDELVEPVDVVIDTVGGALQERSFAILKAGGTLVSAVSPPSAERARERSVRACFILVDVTTPILTELARLLDDGALKTHVGTVLPLAEARRAHEILEGQQPRTPGKILLAVTERARSQA